LDGEIVAWSGSVAEALPFAELQKRLGRKRVTRELMRQVPVVYCAFDVLYAGGQLVIDRPLRERAEILDRAFTSARAVEDVPVQDVQGQFVFEPVLADGTTQPGGARPPSAGKAE